MSRDISKIISSKMEIPDILPPQIVEKEVPLTDETAVLPGRIVRSEGLELFLSYLTYQGLGVDNANGFNHWIEKNLRAHIGSRSITFRYVTKEMVELRLTEAVIDYPVSPIDKKSRCFPSEALKRRFTYASDVYFRPCLFKEGTNEKIPGGEYRDLIYGFSIPVPLRTKLCNLHGLTDEQLMKVGHDPDDPGTYFIIDGEKMIMPYIEKLRLNQIHIRGPSKREKYPHASQVFLTSTGTTMMKAIIMPKKGYCALEIITLGKNNLDKRDATDPQYNTMNVLNVALLIDYYYHTEAEPSPISNQKVPIEIIFRDAMRKFMPKSSNPRAWNHIYAAFQITLQFYYRTPRDSIIDRLIKNLDISALPDRKKAETITTFIERQIFPTAMSKSAKIYMLANLSVMMLAYESGVIEATNLNKWGFRKLDTSAVELARRLRLGLTYAMNNLKKNNSEQLSKEIDLETIVTFLRNELPVVTTQLISPFKPSMYGQEIKFLTTERIDFNNLTNLLFYVNKVHVNVSKKTKSMDLRNVQFTHFGYICPEFTPDNEQAGLVKAKTPTSGITVDVDPVRMIEIIIHLGLIAGRSSETHPYPAFVNGIIIGYCAGKETQRELARMRRLKRYDGGHAGVVHIHTCVVFNQNEHLLIFTDEGRCIRPVSYVEDRRLLAHNLGYRNKSFEFLLNEGCVGWIDAYEEEYEMVATGEQELKADTEMYNYILQQYTNLLAEGKEESVEAKSLLADLQNRDVHPYGYCTLHPLSMFDITVASQVFIENQQSARITFGAKMQTQAMGLNPLSAQHTSARFLTSPERALINSVMTSRFGLSNQPSGLNANIALMSTEYNQEDALEMSATMAKQLSYVRRFKKMIKLENPDEKFIKPTFDTKDKEKIFLYRGITKDGFPVPGVEYVEGQVIVSRMSKSLDGSIKELPTKLGRGERGYVVDIIHCAATNSQGKKIPEMVTIIIEDYRESMVGDKFATRHGQKYTCGNIREDVDMPFITDGPSKGESVDIIINPHCIGSRMTAGLLCEALLGNAAVLDIVNYDGSSYEDHTDMMDIVKRILVMHGYSSNGTCTMTRGDIGEEMKGEVFTGPMFIMKLCHLVQEKAQGAGANEKDKNMQAKKGRQNITGGSVRFGEMEWANALAHGAPLFALQRTSTFSDAIKMVVCRNCFSYCWNIEETECPFCGSTKGFALQTINNAAKTHANMHLSTGQKIVFKGTVEDEYLSKMEERARLAKNQKIDPESDLIEEPDSQESYKDSDISESEDAEIFDYEEIEHEGDF